MRNKVLGRIVSNTMNVIKRNYSKLPEIGKIRYSKTHEYLRIEKIDGMNVGTIGISPYASKNLGEIIHNDMMVKENSSVVKGKIMGCLESVKTVNDIYFPVDCIVLEENKKAIEEPRIITEDPLGEGWLLKVCCINKNDKDLMDNEEYYKYVEEIKAQYKCNDTN